jgi:3-mercaptopyruvate sulfurtransferase SseA
MRKAVMLFAAGALIAGAAGAQYKPSAPNATPLAVGATPPAAASVEQAIAKVQRITDAEATRLLSNGSAVMVDVRSSTQFELGHIKGAVNVPGSQIVARIRELPPRKMIITYCA